MSVSLRLSRQRAIAVCASSKGEGAPVFAFGGALFLEPALEDFDFIVFRLNALSGAKRLTEV